MADTARHEAGQVATEVRDQAANLTRSTREELHEQARTQTDHVGRAMDGLGERIQALADGHPEDAGNVQEIAQSIARQVKTVSGRIDELGFDGAIDELQRFARRRPGAFLAGAAAVGFAAARLTQGVRSADDEDSASRPAPEPTGQPADRQRHRLETGDSSLPPFPPAEEHRPGLHDDNTIVLPEPATDRLR